MPSLPIRLTAAAAALLVLLGACTSGTARAPDAVAEATPAAGPVFSDTLCANPARWNQLCADIPHEVSVALPLGYRGLSPTVQPHFDQFSWQSFIALNWPAGPDGMPLPGSFTDHPGAPRVWETYRDAAQVYWGQGAAECASNAPGGRVLLAQMAKNGHVVDPDGAFDEAVGGPLVDRNLNFVVYEKKMNPDEVEYVLANRLNTVAGQAAADTIDFPAGTYGDSLRDPARRVGAIEMKASWRILQAGRDDTTRFHTRRATVYVPAANSQTGRALCIDATLGLVGLHIAHKTERFSQWVWSTFEHVDNAPTCPDSVPANRCAAPATRYSFFDAACPNCARNDSLRLPAGDSTFLWAAQPPYAARYAVAGRFGQQITRVDSVYAPTEALNAQWRRRLAGTVWGNYRLIGSQWMSGGDGAPLAAPQTLGNTTLESFIPRTSSCLGCHAFATTTNPDPTREKFGDFSFLLGMAGQGPTALPRASARQGAVRR